MVRGFRAGDKYLVAGTELSREAILGFAHANRNSLIEKGFLTVWPPHAGSNRQGGGERYVISMPFGRGYDVVEGRKLNSEPLTKEQAHELAGIAVTDKSAH